MTNAVLAAWKRLDVVAVCGEAASNHFTSSPEPAQKAGAPTGTPYLVLAPIPVRGDAT
jgi:hypothetical protein